MTDGTYNQYGSGSIGSAEHTGSGDIVAGGKHIHGPGPGEQAIDVLLREVEALRAHLDASDRAEVDAAIGEINSNPPPERFNKLLQKIAGIATLVGAAGTPVITAIKMLLGSP
ncbi:hypothetical protein ACH4TV_45515 [Streptomyces sp. NPDC020898]|uniref:hypothetical protein n=1 Tax=Streptomyces sp. NPDC020898 TaxID=3365101 RepID=UPI003792FB7E